MEKVYLVVEDLFWNGDENHEVKSDAFRNIDDAKAFLKEEKQKFLERYNVNLNDENESYMITDRDDWFSVADIFSGDSYDVSIIDRDLV